MTIPLTPTPAPGRPVLTAVQVAPNAVLHVRTSIAANRRETRPPESIEFLMPVPSVITYWPNLIVYLDDRISASRGVVFSVVEGYETPFVPLQACRYWTVT